MIGVYVGTKYSLLLSLIHILKEKKEVIFFIDEELLSMINLNKFKTFKMKQFKEKNTMLVKVKKLCFHNEVLKELKKIKEIYLQDHLKYSPFFLNNYDKNIFLVEDGLLLYNEKILKIENERNAIKPRLNNYIRKVFIEKRKIDYKKYGLSSKIKKIYLTGLLSTPKLIKNKVEIVDINKAWEELSKEAKKNILEVFSIDTKRFNKLKREENKVLLLTQPLSEDRIITEEEKIEIYEEILKKEKRKVYIKPHPREETDYKKIFKAFNIELIENSFPVELLHLTNIEFNEVITIFSTGALNFRKKSKIKFIGTEKYPKLYERFGKIEYK